MSAGPASRTSGPLRPAGTSFAENFNPSLTPCLFSRYVCFSLSDQSILGTFGMLMFYECVEINKEVIEIVPIGPKVLFAIPT